MSLSIPNTCITTAWACKILRDGQNKNELLSNLTENVSDENSRTSQDSHRNDDADGVEKKRNSKSKKLELVKKITGLRIEVGVLILLYTVIMSCYSVALILHITFVKMYVL